MGRWNRAEAGLGLLSFLPRFLSIYSPLKKVNDFFCLLGLELFQLFPFLFGQFVPLGLRLNFLLFDSYFFVKAFRLAQVVDLVIDRVVVETACQEGPA